MNLTDKQKQFVELAISEGFGETITTRDIKELQANFKQGPAKMIDAIQRLRTSLREDNNSTLGARKE